MTIPSSIEEISRFLDKEKSFKLSEGRFKEFIEFFDDLIVKPGLIVTSTQGRDSTLYVVAQNGWLMYVDVDTINRVVSVRLK